MNRSWTLPGLAAEARLAAGLLLALTLFLIWDQSHWWGLRPDYSFGYIVPFFVAYVLRERWPRLREILSGPADDPLPPDPAPPWLRPVLGATFGAMAAGGMILFVFGAVYRAAEGIAVPASFTLATGYAALLLALAYLFSAADARGRPVPLARRAELVGLCLFPALIWLLSSPLFGTLEKTISTFLQNRVVFIVFQSFDLLGLPLERQGSILILPMGEVGVEDACSGIRSLTACLFAGSFLAAVFLDRFWKKALLVASAMALAFCTNILRSLFLTGWAYRHGSDSLDGAVHDITGYAVLGLTVAGLLVLLPLFSLRLEYDAPARPTSPPKP